MRKILVTGGVGYIGSHTIIDLLNNGYDVISIDNFINSKPETIKRIFEVTGKHIKNYVIDLCDFSLLRSIFESENPEHIIHFAALKSVPESVNQPLEYYYNNLQSLINLLELSKEFQITNFVFSSSCSVYGNAKILPVTEESPMLESQSPYASTKQFSEKIISDFSKVSPIKFTILRYFNPVGNHDSGLIGEDSFTQTSLVPSIIRLHLENKQFIIHGDDYPTRDGTPIRDFIHVMDISEAHTKSLNYDGSNLEILNLGTGNGISVLEVINSFEKVTGRKLNWTFGPRRDGDVVEIYADNKKSSLVLNWKPVRDLDSMVLSTWNWMTNSKIF
jgi:UDP-glucose 4-epimerase